MEKENCFLKDVGKRIAHRRKQMHLSQEQLAEKAGISTQVISTAERGVKAIRVENLYKISQVLSVSSDYLLTGQTESLNRLYPETDIESMTDEQSQLIQEIIERCVKLGKLLPRDSNEK